MSCDCIEQINGMLAERNTKLSPTLIFGTKDRPGYVTATIETEALTPKRGARPVSMLPSHCPFCGTRYDPLTTPTA